MNGIGIAGAASLCSTIQISIITYLESLGILCNSRDKKKQSRSRKIKKKADVPQSSSIQMKKARLGAECEIAE